MSNESVRPYGRVSDLRIPAVLGALDEAARFVGSLARRAGLGEDAAYRLRLAVDELVTNIVVHGYREHAGRIGLRAGIEPDRVWLRIEDSAPPFDPLRGRLEPDDEAPPDARRIGGLGIHLALTSVDDVRYARREGHNITTLTVMHERSA